jgi:hypothetical protein
MRVCAMSAKSLSASTDGKGRPPPPSAIFAATLLTEDRVAGDDLALHVAPLREFQCIGNFEAVAARGFSEDRL